MKYIYSRKISSPHIPFYTSLGEGLDILRTVSLDIEKREEEEKIFYKSSSFDFEIGFYEENENIVSVWYDDKSGRLTSFGKSKKISLYLERYGSLNDWDKGINNGWMQFYFNEKENIGMAYGIHMDVIRFNRHLT